MRLFRKILSSKNSRDIFTNHRNNPVKKPGQIQKNKNIGSRFNQNLSFFPSGKYSSCSSSSEQDQTGRHQFHPDIEKAINQQILTEFTASYTYLSMSVFFGRTNIALPGCQGFFYNMYLEEIDHAVVFMNYQLMRGGQVILCAIEAPEKDWGTIDKAFCAGLQLEESVKEKIDCLTMEAEKHHDHQLVDFLTSQYLKEQNECIQKMGRLLIRARKMIKDPNGEFLFDRQLFLNYVKDKNLMFLTHIPDAEDKEYK